MTITDFLSRQPRTKRDLAALAGISGRHCESLIQQARLEGAAIVSDGAGYRLSDDPAEVAACADALRRRFIHQALTARALKRTARRMAAPELTLFGEVA